MNEFIETLRTWLDKTGELTEVLLNAISLICIIAGVVLSFKAAAQRKKTLTGEHPFHTYFRSVFGGWLIVALEFQLAADIVGTIVSPTSQHLIELGAIAVIRTFLNYFLSKELAEQRELTRTLSDKSKSNSD